VTSTPINVTNAGWTAGRQEPSKYADGLRDWCDLLLPRNTFHINI